MHKTVSCICDDEATALRALIRLKDAGFDGEDISLLLSLAPGDATEADAAGPDGAEGDGAEAEPVPSLLEHGAIRWLEGLERVTLHGLGDVLVAGALADAVAEEGAQHPVAALTALGVGPSWACRYESRLRHGGALLAVRATASTVARAEAIFESSGAESISRARTGEFTRLAFHPRAGRGTDGEITRWQRASGL